MSCISKRFKKISKHIQKENTPSESYIGVLLYTFRRRRNLSRKELADQWGMNEAKLLRIECGYASDTEVSFILSKMGTKE